jgi:hypothetical protein
MRPSARRAASSTASDKLNQLTRFANNELVSFDLHAIAAALGDKVTPEPEDASSKAPH